jgi:hypothetical protein
MGPGPGVDDAHDRVAIVGLDGVARTKADFTPRQKLVVGNAAPLLQPEARVAGGNVFYIDGRGVVRELTLAGSKQLATFSLKAQQELSFAVSPDGRQLEASRFTYPAVNPNASNPGDIFLPGKYRYELLAADAGGATRTMASGESDNGFIKEPEVVAWDSSGPIATTDSAFGTQQGAQGRSLWGHAVNLDAAGHPGPIFGGPDCGVVSISGDVVLCVDDGWINYSVRTRRGSTAWSLPTPPQGSYYSNVVLSPDQRSIAYSGAVRSRDGATIALPAKFNPEGWLDNQTLIGVTGDNNQQEMAVVHLSSPTQLDDLGFKGEFIGVVQRPQA